MRGDDEDQLVEEFDTEAEAKGFAYGLTYGDEPDWSIDSVEPNATWATWVVTFRHNDY